MKERDKVDFIYCLIYAMEFTVVKLFKTRFVFSIYINSHILMSQNQYSTKAIKHFLCES